MTGERGLTAEQLLLEAYRLGRDLEAHAHERFTSPANYDRVCEYVAEETERLVLRLRALWMGSLRPVEL
jgi:hypothetical protein